MIETPQVIQTESQPSAIIRFTIPRSQMQEVMGPGIEEIMATTAAQNIDPAGPVFAHHLRMDPDTFDFELGVPVATPVAETGRVKPGELPAATVARTVYHGAYDGLPAAWGEFDAWIRDNGYTSGPDVWESYVVHPDSDSNPANWRTELNRPLKGGPVPEE